MDKFCQFMMGIFFLLTGLVVAPMVTDEWGSALTLLYCLSISSSFIYMMIKSFDGGK